AINGWSVQYASASGAFTSTQLTVLNGTLPPGTYYLVQEAAGNSCGGSPCGSPLPVPEATGPINLSANSGKVALVSSTVLLSGSCPTDGTIVDFVGYGTTATCFEGS